MEEENTKRMIHAPRQGSFVLSTIASFFILSLFLFSIDFVPELTIESDTHMPDIAVKAVADTSLSTASINTIEEEKKVVSSQEESFTPVRIVIQRIGLDTPILTPVSTEIAVLDRALLSGAVRYPGSGNLGENANMLLFGHSSYLPVVHNKAFKAFNELGNLKVGDTVNIYSKSHVYVYEVNRVRLSDAENVIVNFNTSMPVLTLATCNTFGAKQERWIITADLLSKRPI